jgi:hypothetical protein
MGMTWGYELRVSAKEVDFLNQSSGEIQIEKILPEDVEFSPEQGEFGERFVDISIEFALIDPKHPTGNFFHPLRSFMEKNKIPGRLIKFNEYAPEDDEGEVLFFVS